MFNKNFVVKHANGCDCWTYVDCVRDIFKYKSSKRVLILFTGLVLTFGDVCVCCFVISMACHLEGCSFLNVSGLSRKLIFASWS